MALVISARDKLIKQIKLRMGDGMIDLYLDQDHYDFALDSAFDRYRTRSGNSVQESFIFLDVQPNVTDYTLPQNVQSIKDIYRRTFGGTVSGGSGDLDPFSLAATNNIFMLQSGGGYNGTGVGTLATYELAKDYQKLIGKTFGQNLQYTFNQATKRLVIERRFNNVEQILLHALTERSEDELLADTNARQWIRDYSVAQAKIIEGEARSKFSNIAGPSGGISLNGQTLKDEGKAEMERLDLEIKLFVDSSQGYGFIIG